MIGSSLRRMWLPAVGIGMLVASQTPARAINPVEVTYNGVIYSISRKLTNFNSPNDPTFASNGNPATPNVFIPAPAATDTWEEQPWWTGNVSEGQPLDSSIAKKFSELVANQLTNQDGSVVVPLFAFATTKNTVSPTCSQFVTPDNRTCSMQYNGTIGTLQENNNGNNLYYAYVTSSRPVPAPLPAVGLAGFLIYSRRLRRRIAKQA